MIILAISGADLIFGDGLTLESFGRSLGFYALWWITFVGWALLGRYVIGGAERQDAAATAPTGQPPINIPPDNEKTLEASIDAMTSTIDRLEASIDRMEKSAALVPGALGIIATIAIARLNPELTGLPLYVGIIVATAGIRAIIDATRCLASYRLAGVSGYGELWRVDRDYIAYQSGRINHLVDLLKFAHHAAAQKRVHLRLALVETVVAVTLLYYFALLGGFEPPVLP